MWAVSLAALPGPKSQWLSQERGLPLQPLGQKGRSWLPISCARSSLDEGGEDMAGRAQQSNTLLP